MVHFLRERILIRRTGLELALLAAMGLFFAIISPYETVRMAAADRYSYWLLCIVGGGVIGIVIDEAIGRRLRRPWQRILAVSLLMTPFVTALVYGMEQIYTGGMPPSLIPLLCWRVFAICVPVMAVRALAWRAPKTIVEIETRTVVAPPLPEAEAAFRARLSAKRRTARLLAVEAYDHYLRVHTDEGEELVTLRFADALEELAGAHGFKTHRSWWVSAGAIEAVVWRRGTGEARLAGGLLVPVSRAQAPILKEAGWF